MNVSLFGEPRQWTGPELAWLMRHDKVGSKRALEVAEIVSDPDSFANVWPDVRPSREWAMGLPAVDPDRDHSYSDVECIGYFDDNYPSILRTIPRPPAVLWLRGKLMADESRLAVVGTRNPDEWGTAVATEAAEWAVAHDVTVVSGLAFGCDTVAHTVAVREGGTTIAVLAGSLMRPTPSRNQALADRILETGGGLLSERFPDAEVNAGQLVARNRIQSGLSVATVVAQTAVPGGTLHTARFTIEQGRRLIVARPVGVGLKDSRNAGSVRLTDPDGSDPGFLHASKGFAASIALRTPIADESPANVSELQDALAASF